MRTLYFNASPLTDPAPDASWDTLAHWSDESGHPALALPENGDAVVIRTRLGAPSNPITLSSILVTNPAPIPNQDGNAVNFTGAIGDAVFEPGTYNDGTVTGNAEFKAAAGGANTFNGGTVTGNAVFREGASNSGTVNGDAVFQDAGNYATVAGSAAFEGAGAANRGTVNGNATFSGGANNGAQYAGTDPAVQGAATFSDGSVNYATVNDALFSGGSVNAGQVLGTGTFTGTSSNSGNVSVAIFKDHSTNTGTFGEATTYFPVARPMGGGPITWVGYYNFKRTRRSEVVKDTITEQSWPINVTAGIEGDRMELWLTAQGDCPVTFDPSIKIPQALALPVLPDGETYVIELRHNGQSWALASVGGYGVKAALVGG